MGDSSWTFKEVQDYFQLRLSTFPAGGQEPENFKKEVLKEIFLKSFVENWAKQKQLQSQKINLSEEEKANFLKHNSNLKTLKDNKSYLSLYSLLLKDLFEKTATPPLAEQHIFYNKNKTWFIEPASCHLKQILVEKEKIAYSLYQKLKQGESFDQLSRLHSLKKNPGWIKKGVLNVFDKACFNHKGPLSPVLKSLYGYHIFLVGEKKPSQQKRFKQVQKQIIKNLKTNRVKEQFQVWLKQEITKTPLFTNKKLLDKIRIQYKTNEI